MRTSGYVLRSLYTACTSGKQTLAFRDGVISITILVLVDSGLLK